MDEKLHTPRYRAVVCGRVNVVKSLLAMDADISCIIHGGTLAHNAETHGKVYILEALIGRHGALLDICNNDGHTPLCCAIEHGHAKVVNSLLEKYKSQDRLQEVFERPCKCNGGPRLFTARLPT